MPTIEKIVARHNRLLHYLQERIERARAKLRAVSNIVNSEDAENHRFPRTPRPVVNRTLSDPDMPSFSNARLSSAVKRKPLVSNKSDPNMSMTPLNDTRTSRRVIFFVVSISVYY